MPGYDRSYLRPGAIEHVFGRILGLDWIGPIRGHFCVPWAKDWQDNLAAGGLGGSRRAALSGLRPDSVLKWSDRRWRVWAHR